MTQKIFSLLTATLLSLSLQSVHGQDGFVDYSQLLQKIEEYGNRVDLAPFATSKHKDAYNEVDAYTSTSKSLPKPQRKIRNAEAVYASAKDAVLTLGVFYLCGNCDKWHANVSATAVALSEAGVCATNYHVMEELLGLGKSKTDSIALAPYAFAADIHGNVYPIKELLSYSKNGDLAVFQLDNKERRLHAIPLGETANVGSRVYALSHPHGGRYPYYFSDGQVARNVVKRRGQKHGERMEITADYAVGSSGGAILDNRGNLVGLVSATEEVYADRMANTGLQMVVKETIPVTTLKSLLSSTKLAR